MIRGKAILVALFIGLATGLFLGAVLYSHFICPDVNKAVVEQLKKDGKKVQIIEKIAEVRHVETRKAVAVIETTPTDECFDVPIPDESADVMLDSLLN